jgi:hypothetical protein
MRMANVVKVVPRDDDELMDNAIIKILSCSSELNCKIKSLCALL